jgi:hypothetical protein
LKVQSVCLTAPSGRVLSVPFNMTPFSPTDDETVATGTILQGFGTDAAPIAAAAQPATATTATSPVAKAPGTALDILKPPIDR